jgi:hypothetical protein
VEKSVENVITLEGLPFNSSVEQAFLYTETAIKEIATLSLQIGGSKKGTISNIKQKIIEDDLPCC